MVKFKPPPMTILKGYFLFHFSFLNLPSSQIYENTTHLTPLFPPSPTAITSPFSAFLSPVFLDDHKIPTDRPLMFVSNHTIMGLDYPLLLTKLWGEKKVFIRALADHSHFQVSGGKKLKGKEKKKKKNQILKIKKYILQ